MQQWLETILGSGFSIAPASADASFRSYWRVTLPHGQTHIVMDAPPAQENIAPWLDIGERLKQAGLHAPEVIAFHAAQGFVLMEDLGAQTFLTLLDSGTADTLYGMALDGLVQMQQHVVCDGLPTYDDKLLLAELELMPTWFLERHLGYPVSAAQRKSIDAANAFLVDSALQQPTAFVHRDYHSRNLLLPAGERMAIIDFQDGVLGPVTYDLVSLLRDSYIRWPVQRVDDWMVAGRQRLIRAGVLDAAVDQARFRHWFDLMGVQRQLKVLGVFCRLWYRDGKGQYLRDLPMTWHYLDTVAARHEPLRPLLTLLHDAIGSRDLAAPQPSSVPS